MCNEFFNNLEETEDFPAKDKSRNLRRYNKRKAFKHREYIFTHHRGYKPSVGWYKYKKKYNPQTQKHECFTDKRQIQSCHHSRPQQYVKHRSVKVIRRLPIEEIYGKGNTYRRYIDYFWELYWSRKKGNNCFI